jgi:hypothetical protein
MTETDAERFRKEAEECRGLAVLRLASDWIKLAGLPRKDG